MARIKNWRGVSLLLLLPGVLVMSSCQPQATSSTSDPPSPQAAWPAFDYRDAAQGGALVYALDPAKSQVDIVVRRAGKLARFGHDHVIVAANPEGWLLWPEGDSATRADLRIQAQQLIVDPEPERTQYALTTEPSESDIAATSANMLDSVLDSAGWPFVFIEVRELQRGEGGWTADIELTIRGVGHSFRSPIALQRDSESVVVGGSLTLKQTELGIEPFSAFGGGLRVADPLEIHFKFRGEQWTSEADHHASPGGAD